MSSALRRSSVPPQQQRRVATPARRFGYLVAAAMNGVMLWVAHRLLDWGWPGFLTDGFALVLGLVTASLIAGIVVNLALAIHHLILLDSEPGQFFKVVLGSLIRCGIVGHVETAGEHRTANSIHFKQELGTREVHFLIHDGHLLTRGHRRGFLFFLLYRCDLILALPAGTGGCQNQNQKDTRLQIPVKKSSNSD